MNKCISSIKKVIKYNNNGITSSSQKKIAEILILYLDTNLIYTFLKSEIPECIDKSFSEIIQQFVWMKAE